jgi:transcriptional regulator of arginine metabolism
VISDTDSVMMEKYVRVLREGFLSVDMAQNLLVVKTVSGMASAVCAAVDAMKLDKVVGSIAGDDTLLIVIRSEADAIRVMNRLRELTES